MLSTVVNRVRQSEPVVYNHSHPNRCVDDAKVEQEADQLLFALRYSYLNRVTRLRKEVADLKIRAFLILIFL